MAGKSPEGQVICSIELSPESRFSISRPSADPEFDIIVICGVDIIEDVSPKERRVVELNTQAGVYILGKILSHLQSGSYSSSGPPPW